MVVSLGLLHELSLALGKHSISVSAGGNRDGATFVLGAIRMGCRNWLMRLLVQAPILMDPAHNGVFAGLQQLALVRQMLVSVLAEWICCCVGFVGRNGWRRHRP